MLWTAGLLFSGLLWANPPDQISTIVAEILEEYQHIGDLPLNGEELFNDLFTLSQNPINVNAATKSELEALPFLSDFQIENMQFYVYTSGPLLSVYELKAVPGLDEKTIRWLLPFIELGDKESSPAGSKIYSSHAVLVRYAHEPELARGYVKASGNSYLGDRNALLLRVDGEISNGITYHLLTEKDKGETSYTDFIGGGMAFRGKGFISTLVVGDFKVRAGQGLLSWSGSIMGKSMEPDLVRKKGETLSLYKSSTEYGFYRGAAVQMRKSAAELTLWASHLRADATLDSTQSGRVIRTLLTSGYHNTESTLSKKANVSLTSGGANVRWNHPWIRPGFTVLHNRLNLPLLPGSDLSYAHIQSRQYWQQYSADFFSSFKNMHFWGELAYQSGSKFAGILGSTLYPSDALQATLIYRNYAPGFYSLYGNAFGETTSTRNEKGFYLGLKVIPASRLTLSTSLDMYAFPWVRYQQSFPSNGVEAFMRISYRLSHNQQTYLQIRHEKRTKTVPTSNQALPEILQEHRSGVRLHYAVALGNGWESSSRIELSIYRLQNSSTGTLLLQDLAYAPTEGKLSGNIRMAWFQTDSYDARIYAYEQDVLYAFSVPPYFGKGLRTYLNLKYSPYNNVQCWLRLSRLHYFNQETIGSGLNEIPANHRSEVKVQLRLKF